MWENIKPEFINAIPSNMYCLKMLKCLQVAKENMQMLQDPSLMSEQYFYWGLR